MTLDEVAVIATRFEGVRQTTVDGLRQWRFHGRLVARQLDRTHLVVRVEFEVRDVLVSAHPETFTAPARFAKHMMVVADLEGDTDAIEDVLEAAWELQRHGD